MQNSFLAEACKQGLWIGGCLWARRDEESLSESVNGGVDVVTGDLE